MRYRTVAKRLVLTVSASSLLVATALGTTPAQAMDTGGGVVLAVAVGGLHNVAATLSYDATPTGLGYSVVTFNCKAVASVDPASTGIGECNIGGTEAINSPNNTPGAVSVAAGVVLVPDGARPWACVGGHANFLESLLGPSYVQTGTECDPLNLVTI